ncbi:unnamed protein product [Arabidopsis lyrata]|uniref:Predicted protein n=2 Tax=Arabidopsis TaxID=3701 RepID=D7LP65_ARALL|nr:predicted protein [Arabidopsis lyrata subsp. lyrata]CAE5979559.1 unnamed protein product [Arabidopsis arenosa]CAH8255782.1 unnamed protein product [Arabidopsis lyrata]
MERSKTVGCPSERRRRVLTVAVVIPLFVVQPSGEPPSAAKVGAWLRRISILFMSLPGISSLAVASLLGSTPRFSGRFYLDAGGTHSLR